MTAYHATARRDGRYWLVNVDGVGVTQGRNLADASEMAQDLVVALLGADPSEVSVILEVELPEGLGARAEAARRVVAEAAEAQQRAAEASRAVVRALREVAGFSGKDVAALLGVSEQRVSQLLATRSASRTEAKRESDDEVTVRLAWVEPLAESLTVVEGQVSRASVWRGEMVMDAEASPGPAGVYRLITEEEGRVMDPQDPVPVFLFESHQAAIIKWMKPLETAELEAATAETVRRAVFDLVEARIAEEGVFSTSVVLTRTEEVDGALHVVGSCVVVRPTAARAADMSSTSIRLYGHGGRNLVLATSADNSAMFKRSHSSRVETSD